MKNSKVTICDEVIHPGETISLALPLPELFSCAPMYMPIKVTHGKNKGPVLLVVAAIHGNELNGTEIIHQLLKRPELEDLCGTLIAIPIINVYGFINRSRTLPGGSSLNQSFPGSPNGSHAARLADLISTRILPLADYCIDLQTGFLNHSNLPQVFVGVENQVEMDLAETFGAPVIARLEPEPGSLRETANAQDVPFLVYEAGEAMRFDEHAIEVGVQGILNIMQKLEMLDKALPEPVNPTSSFLVKTSSWVRSPTSGISHSQIRLGAEVKKGQSLSMIKDPFGAGHDVPVTAPADGIIVGKNNLPLVHEGATLFQIASFSEMAKAVSHFENWKPGVEDEAGESE